MVLARAISRRVVRSVLVLLSCCVAFLHAQAEVGLLQRLDFGFDASKRLLAQFSSFGHFHGLLNYAPR